MLLSMHSPCDQSNSEINYDWSEVLAIDKSLEWALHFLEKSQ